MNKSYKLDKEEKELLNELETLLDEGKLEIKPLRKKERARLSAIASNSMNKSKTISIRISEKDLVKVKAKASRLGLPYQTYISSLIHQNNN